MGHYLNFHEDPVEKKKIFKNGIYEISLQKVIDDIGLQNVIFKKVE